MPPIRKKSTADALPSYVTQLASKTDPGYEPRLRAPSRRKGDPLVFIDTITPQRAADILTYQNARNRQPRKAVIEAMARDMALGEFDLNGESIKFDTEGNLADGQNRCYAGCMANVPFDTVIVEGISPKGQQTMDAGTKRIVSDDLKIRGEMNTAVLGSLLLRVATWNWAKHEYGYGNYVNRVHYKPSKKEQLALMYDPITGKDTAEADALRAATKRGQALYQIIAVPQSCWAFTVYKCTEQDEAEAKEFFRRMERGADPIADEPSHLLRETLIQRRNKEQRTSVNYQRTPESVYAALIFLAWNAYVEGVKIKRLSFRAGGATPDRFPEPEAPQS